MTTIAKDYLTENSNQAIKEYLKDNTINDYDDWERIFFKLTSPTQRGNNTIFDNQHILCSRVEFDEGTSILLSLDNYTMIDVSEELDYCLHTDNESENGDNFGRTCDGFNKMYSILKKHTTLKEQWILYAEFDNWEKDIKIFKSKEECVKFMEESIIYEEDEESTEDGQELREYLTSNFINNKVDKYDIELKKDVNPEFYNHKFFIKKTTINTTN